MKSRIIPAEETWLIGAVFPARTCYCAVANRGRGILQQDYSKFIQTGLTAAAVLGFATWQLWAARRQRRQDARLPRDTEDNGAG